MSLCSCCALEQDVQCLLQKEIGGLWLPEASSLLPALSGSLKIIMFLTESQENDKSASQLYVFMFLSPLRSIKSPRDLLLEDTWQQHFSTKLDRFSQIMSRRETELRGPVWSEAGPTPPAVLCVLIHNIRVFPSTTLFLSGSGSWTLHKLLLASHGSLWARCIVGNVVQGGRKIK